MTEYRLPQPDDETLKDASGSAAEQSNKVQLHSDPPVMSSCS